MFVMSSEVETSRIIRTYDAEEIIARDSSTSIGMTESDLFGAWDLEFSEFAAELQRATIFIRYDEGTAQAQGLADDRHRRSGDPVRFLFRATAGLWRDALRSICSHVRPKCFHTGSAANGAAPEPGAGPRHV